MRQNAAQSAPMAQHSIVSLQKTLLSSAPFRPNRPTADAFGRIDEWLLY